MNIIFTTIKNLNRLYFVLLILVFVLIGTEKTVAQNYEHTKHKVDQTLRSNARVNPSTLAVEMSIPIADMSGRGGASMPLVFNYSSKVWELETDGTNYRNGEQARVTPRYSSKAMAGWTSSYGIPKIHSTPDLYDCYGSATDGLAVLPPGCGFYYYSKKMRVTFPGGTTHELRKDDGLYTTSTGQPDKTGAYYAVDGSRVRLEWGSGGTSTLFLADGGRYFFDAQEYCYQYIDRHGNLLAYNSTTGAWTDTLGRTLTAPIPFTNQQIQNQGEETKSFTVPGLGTSTREYQLVWKKLSSGALANGYALSYDSRLCPLETPARDPLLFELSTWAVQVCSVLPNGKFDPVVLSEIILPNGQKYKFAYTSHGEIARIDYPTGAYEKFVYDQVRAISWDYEANSFIAESYAQANRGVAHRYVGAGDGAAEQHWQYEVSYVSTVHELNTYQVKTTAPDGTVEKRYLHRSRNPLLGSEYGNWGFDTALAGMEMETQTIDPNEIMRSRKLFDWDVTTGASPEPNAVPERDPRIIRAVNLIFEPNEDYALAQLSETVYDTAGNSDPAYFSSLNPIRTKIYKYKVVSLSEAQTANINTIAGLFSSSDLETETEVDYLYDANYKARNITGLVTETRIKDASGVVKAKSQISYDQTSYLESPTITNAPGWSNPNTIYRGLPTSVRSWTDITNNPNQYIETHTLYDQFGNVRKTWDGKGNYSEIQYTDNYTDNVNRSSYALPTKTISYSGNNGTGTVFETTVKYDFKTGLPISTTDPNGQTSTVEYNDALLRPTKAIAPNGHQTITIYGVPDSSGQLPATQRFIKVKSQIDANNWKEGYSWFDGLGRTIKTQSVDSDGDVFTLTCYDNYGRLKEVSNPFRNVSNPSCQSTNLEWTTNTYDSFSRLSRVTTPDGAFVETIYELATSGNQIGTSVTVKDQASKERRSITNALGQLIRVDEPDLNNNNQLGTIGSPNQPTYYSYDTLNNLTTVTQGSQTRTFAYDSLSRLKQAQNPESGLIQYAYDNNGNLTSKTDARGVITTYLYDAMNRVTQRSYANEPSGQAATPAVIYTYDNLANAKGKLTKVTNGTLTNGIISNPLSETEYQAFDNMGRVTQSQQEIDGTAYGDPMTYTYNLSGALIEQKYPSGRKVQNVLNEDGELEIVKSKKTANHAYFNYANHFSYTAAGALSSMQLGNGRWESTQFNNRLQPTQIALGATQSATNLLKLDYTYNTQNNNDNNGNVLSQTITVPTVGQNTGFTAVQTYTYDSLNRLKSATENLTPTGGTSVQSWKQTFDYDRYGNRTFDETNPNGNPQTTTLTGGCGITSYNPNGICNKEKVNPNIDTADNRIIEDQDGDNTKEYEFDAAGNTKKDAQGRTFTYDGENKQTKVMLGSIKVGEYFYDGDGKRVKKIDYDQYGVEEETTIFVYDASGKLVAEYSTQQPASATNAKVSYLTNDHLGSPRILTDANGKVISRRDFHPFGEEIYTQQRISGLSYTTDSVRQKFTSYERDNETKLDFAQARYHNYYHGRFNTVDPIIVTKNHIVNPQRWNMYIFVLNCPTSLLDPDGREGKGNGGGKIIDIFITHSRKENPNSPNWNRLKKEAKRKGYTINIYTVDNKTATVERFQNSIYQEGRTVILVGHSTSEPKGQQKVMEGGALKGDGLSFSNGTIQGEIITDKDKNVSGMSDIQAKNLAVFTCNSGDTLDSLTSTVGTQLLYWQGGNDGLMPLYTGEVAAYIVAETIINGGEISEALEPTNYQIDRNRDFNCEFGDITIKCNAGDSINHRTITTRSEVK